MAHGPLMLMASACCTYHHIVQASAAAMANKAHVGNRSRPPSPTPTHATLRVLARCRGEARPHLTPLLAPLAANHPPPHPKPSNCPPSMAAPAPPNKAHKPTDTAWKGDLPSCMPLAFGDRRCLRCAANLRTCLPYAATMHPSHLPRWSAQPASPGARSRA